MKIAVNTWCYRDKRLEEFVPVLGKMGFEYLDLGTGRPTDLCSHVILDWSEDRLFEVKEFCQRYGIEISVLHASNDLSWPEEEKRREQIDLVKRNVEIADYLEVGIVILHDGWCEYPEEKLPEVFGWISEGFKECCEYAEKYGIKLAFENHGIFSSRGDPMLELVKSVDRPNFGVNYDPGNFAIMGEDPVKAGKLLAPYIIHSHLKDVVEEKGKLKYTAIGDGFVNWKEVLSILHEINYKGLLTVEYEGDLPPEEGISRSLSSLNSLISAV